MNASECGMMIYDMRQRGYQYNGALPSLRGGEYWLFYPLETRE